jgi:hypothetical protein
LAKNPYLAQHEGPVNENVSYLYLRVKLSLTELRPYCTPEKDICPSDTFLRFCCCPKKLHHQSAFFFPTSCLQKSRSPAMSSLSCLLGGRLSSWFTWRLGVI